MDVLPMVSGIMIDMSAFNPSLALDRIEMMQTLGYSRKDIIRQAEKLWHRMAFVGGDNSLRLWRVLSANPNRASD